MTANFPESRAGTTWNRLAERLEAALTHPGAAHLPKWAASAIEEAAQRCAERDPDGAENDEGDDDEGPSHADGCFLRQSPEGGWCDCALADGAAATGEGLA